MQYHNHHHIECTVCHVLIHYVSLRQVPCHEFWVCLFTISDCLFSLGMSSLHVRLAVSFSCHMHSQCVAMGAALYVKLSRAFTTSKCNFRQGQRVSLEHTVSGLLNSQDCWFCLVRFPNHYLWQLGNLTRFCQTHWEYFHKIVMTLLCAGPLAPSTVVPMQNRR